MLTQDITSECGTLRYSLHTLSDHTAVVYIYCVNARLRTSRQIMRQEFDNVDDAEKWAQEKMKNVVWTLLQA